MKKVIIIVLTSVLLIGGLIIYKNTPTSTSSQEAVLGARIEAVNGQIIDVRTPKEYIYSHANNAINIPLENILRGDFNQIDKKRPIYIYCRSGVRAGKARLALEKAGYKKVINIGGLNNWINKGGSICKTSKPSC